MTDDQNVPPDVFAILALEGLLDIALELALEVDPDLSDADRAARTNSWLRVRDLLETAASEARAAHKASGCSRCSEESSATGECG